MEKESKLTFTGKQAFITTLVALALSPISILLTYFVTSNLESPRLRSAFVDYIPVTETKAFSSEQKYLLQTYIDDDRLSYPIENNQFLKWQVERLRDILIKYIDSNTTEKRFNEEVYDKIYRWDQVSNIELPYLSIDDKYLEVVARYNKDYALNSVQAWINTSSSLVRDENSLLTTADGMLKTGFKITDLYVKVGIINEGKTDGVLYPDAVATFIDYDLKIPLYPSGRNYNVVPSHSFVELELLVDKAKLSPESQSKWKSVVERFSDRCRISIDSSSGTIVSDGRLFQKP